MPLGVRMMLAPRPRDRLEFAGQTGSGSMLMPWEELAGGEGDRPRPRLHLPSDVRYSASEAPDTAGSSAVGVVPFN